ncbi:MAG TPA: GNAT family N-acetyltransferase [Candidatus Polarisedimenticolia bacterium]|jgi:CelD/BcsL family acetyltransferase involved in cellulose biosynthesis|nr:GNAT family N-acetyltransferase [Candidatus Polarisedimenticolia bacterium]
MRAHSAHPLAALEIGEVNDLPAFKELEREWNALVEATTNEFFHRHEFLRIWMESFAKDARLRILTGRDAAGRLTAALPLMQRYGSLHGLPVRELVATANSHSCRWDLLAEAGAAAGKLFFDYLGNDGSWDVLKLIDVPEDGQAHHLVRAARRAGFPAASWESQRSPYLDLSPEDGRLPRWGSGQLQSLVRRRRRQLLEQGELRLERLTTEGIREALNEFFEMEGLGWKGRQGTACAQDEDTALFYTRLAEEASRSGHLSFFRLKLDGRTIAFHYGLTYAGAYFLPKLGYDEAFGRFSPGLVLIDSVLQDALARRLRRLDFLGSDDEWKLRWSSGVRRHDWLFVFRDNAVGRLLKKAKFDWLPRVKRLWELRRPE